MLVVLERISPDECIEMSRFAATDFSSHADVKTVLLEDSHEWIVQVDTVNAIVSIMMRLNGEEVFEAGLFLKSSSSIMFTCEKTYYRAFFMP